MSQTPGIERGSDRNTGYMLVNYAIQSVVPDGLYWIRE